MTYEEIRNRINQIKAITRDFEIAHSMEDELFHDFARYTATVAGSADPELSCKASAVLKSLDIEFPRHCA